MPANPTCSTKAKRAVCMKRLQELAASTGAVLSVTLATSRAAYARLERDGVSVNITIDGDSRVSSFIAHWCSDRRLCRSFAADIGGSVNPYHGCKATTFADTFDEMLRRVELGFGLVADGNAFTDEAAA